MANPSASKAGLMSKYFKKDNAPPDQDEQKPTEDESNTDSTHESLKQVDNKINFLDSSSDDFRSPPVLKKRNNLAWKLNKGPKQKTKSKKTSNKKTHSRNSTIKIIKENFGGTGENPEHLQMAIALSKSTYELEYGHSSEVTCKKESTDIGEILQNVKPTNLERFGFKSSKSVIPVENRRLHRLPSEVSKRTKNRFKYITPTLTIRSAEERMSLIASKISLILCQLNTNTKRQTEPTLISPRLQYFLSNRTIFRVTFIYENNYFFIEDLNLPKSTSKCGCLLKDFGSIPGRDKSPEKRIENSDHKQEESSTENNDHIKTNNLSRNVSDVNSAIECQRWPLKNASKKVTVSSPSCNIQTTTKSWASGSKDSGLTSFTSKTSCSISSSYRSMSPDLFVSDDEECCDFLNKTNDVTKFDVNKFKTGTDSVDCKAIFSCASQSDVNRDTEVNEDNEVIDLTNDDTEPVNKINSSNSFPRSANFYSLDEFEGIESDTSNQNFIVKEINLDREGQTVKDIEIGNPNTDECVVGKKNYPLAEKNEKSAAIKRRCEKSQSNSSEYVQYNKSTGKSDTREYDQFHDSIDLLDESLSEHFVNMKGDSPIQKDLADNNVFVSSDGACKMNNVPLTDVSGHIPKKVHINKDPSFSSCQTTTTPNYSPTNVNTSPFENEQELDCIEISDDSLPDDHFGDKHKNFCTNPVSRNSKTVHLIELESHNIVSDKNIKCKKSNLNIPPKSCESLMGFGVLDNPLPENNFEDMDTFDENKNDDLTAIKSVQRNKENSSTESQQKLLSSHEINKPFKSCLQNSKTMVDQGLSCIEISDDSLSNHYSENSPVPDGDCQKKSPHGVSNTFGVDFSLTEKNMASNSSAGETSKKAKSLEQLSSSFVQMNELDKLHDITPVDSNKLSSPRKSRMFNSADLNVTDYVNNMLNRENFTFDNSGGLCEDEDQNIESEEISLSQGSQSSEIADEELNYSSHFSTPRRFRTKITKRTYDCDLASDAESAVIQQVSSSQASSVLSTTTIDSASTSSKKHISTPDNYIIKTKNITPMPDYDAMATPLINEELQKVGVKPLKRARGTKLLKYIYESTHPLLGCVEALEKSDSEDEERIIKRRKRSREIVVENIDPCNVHCLSLVEIIGDRILENETSEDLIFERKRPGRIPSCQVPLQIVWHNFVSSNQDIKENILLYEPLQLESLHILLKEQGFKFHIQDLLRFLDKKCITIRTAQGRKHR